MNIMRRGEIAGILCLCAVMASFVAAFVFGTGKSVVGDVVALILYLVVCVTYFVLLLALKEIIKSVGDAAFIHRMNDFLIASILVTLLMSPLTMPLLLPDLFEQILGVVAIVSVAIFGVVSVRIAPFFDKLEGVRAEDGKKACKWLKISGWLMATVVLSFIGAFLSTIADYYLWKLVKNEHLNTK
jgi:hypothetical protein